MKKKTEIINKYGHSITVSEETAKIINEFNKEPEKITKPDFEKPIRKIEDISVEEQVEYLDLMCFPLGGQSAEERVKEVIDWTYGISPRKKDDFTIVNGFDLDQLKSLKTYLLAQIKRESGNKNLPTILKVIEVIITSLPINESPKKYTAKEYALAYILELFSAGKQVPTNRNEGGLNKKHLESIGLERTNKNLKPSTFYDAVKDVLPIVIANKKVEFQHLSNDWLNAVRDISNNNEEIEEYLKIKNLI